MKSTIVASRLEWLSFHNQSFLAKSDGGQDIQKVQHQIPEEIGSGWFQSIHLPFRQVIRRSHITFNPEGAGKLIPLSKIIEHVPEPVLCIQSAKTGRIIISDHLLGKDFIIGQNASLFQHIDLRDHSTVIDSSENIEMTVLIIGNSVLRELCGEEGAHKLLTGLKISTLPSASVNKVPQHIDAILHASIPDNLTGHIAKLHAQSKVLDYLCCLTKYFAPEIERPLQASRILEIVHQVHNDLITLKGKIPTLKELSKRYDIPDRLLSSEFKKAFGKSICSYISEVRLHEAHTALQKTDIPMKTMSKNLGYSHVNHFISAFGKQFGYSPGSLRKY